MQSWKSSDISSHSGQQATRFRESLFEFASDYIYVLWTDEELVAFIKAEYPQYLQFFSSLKVNVKRADIGRYLFIHRFGGIYCDLDIQLLRNVSEVVEGGLRLASPDRFSSSSAATSSYISTVSFDRPVEFFSYKSWEFEKNLFGIPRSASSRQPRGSIPTPHREVTPIPHSADWKFFDRSIISFPLFSLLLRLTLVTPSSEASKACSYS